MIIRTIHEAVVLTTVPKRIYKEDAQRCGLILQNQEPVANIYIRSGGNGVERSFICLPPSGSLMEDILPPHDELWIYSNVDGAILTVVNKYEVSQ